MHVHAKRMIKRAILARELGVPIVMLGVFKIE
jgi:hypothetical protein